MSQANKPNNAPGRSILVAVTFALASVSGAFAQEGQLVHHAISSVHLEAGGYEATRDLSVYLPPGYDQAEKDYPVLYLVHGGGGSHTSFFGNFEHFRADRIADSLIAASAMKPMVIVGLNVDGWGGGKIPPAFSDYVLEEAMSFVESTYSVQRQRSQRGLGGWSLGGNFVVQLALARPDLFRAVATYAGSDPFCRTKLTQQYNSWRNPLNFWIWYGRNDPIFERAAGIVEWLDAAGLPHEFFTDDGDHYGLHQPLVHSLQFFSEICTRPDAPDDLPAVRSGKQYLGVRSTDPAPLRFEIVLESETAPELLLDLTSLGREQVRLTYEGDGRYSHSSPSFAAPTGVHFLPVLLAGAEPSVVFMTRVDVVPAGDVVIVAKALSAGWQVDSGGGAELPIAAGPNGGEGEALAFSVESASFLGWRVGLLSPAPIRPFGYTHMEINIHPGNATGRALNLSIGGVGVKLVDPRGDDLVDLELQDWQTVKIDLTQLCFDEGIAAVAFNGDLEGRFYIDDLRFVAPSVPVVTAVTESRDHRSPESFTLWQNYPNPFNPATTIRFDLPQSQEIELAIYNLAAQRVAILVQGHRVAGSYSVRWDGKDDAGAELASGVYLYRLTAGDRVEMLKLLLLH
jgi:pimeloyl-ACP methyl ester carboxylesterase